MSQMRRIGMEIRQNRKRGASLNVFWSTLSLSIRSFQEVSPAGKLGVFKLDLGSQQHEAEAHRLLMA